MSDLPELPADLPPDVQTSIRCTALAVARDPSSGFAPSDVPDLIQELAFHLIANMPPVDPEKGVESTLVARLLERRVGDLVRERKRTKRGGDAVTLALPVEVVSDARLGVSAADQIDAAALALDVEAVLARLAPEVRRVAQLLMEGCTLVEVSARVGVSRQTLQSREIPALASAFRAAGFLGDFFGISPADVVCSN